MLAPTLQSLEFPKVLRALAGFAVSEAGAAACLALAPLDDLPEIRRRLALLHEAMAWAGETGARLSAFPPLDGLFASLRRPGHLLDQDALFALRQALSQAKTAQESLAGAEKRGWSHLSALAAPDPWPHRTVSALNRCLDHEGHLRDESSPELREARERIRSIHQRCTKKAKDFILSNDLSHFLQDDFMTISSDRYVLPFKSNFKGRFPGIIHDYSQTGETCYFEPMFLVEINNQLQELKQEEREAERKILLYLTDLVRAEETAVAAAYDFLVELDLLLAKVGLAAAMQGRVVDVEEDAEPRLLAARHPLLALEGSARPLDIELPDGQKALIISGGNAGGKTVCLKTAGLAALMSYAGLAAAVDEGSRLPLWRDIFVIMGDEQSLEDHVSTFTAQVRRLSRVWDHAGPHALFLLDEFGAGTDPAQGAALAQAVVDSALARGASLMAATHFPALKAYALATPRVRAASVLFDPRTKKPLFRLAYDQVGASIALDVAREHGLPPEILSRAEQYLLLDGSDTGAVLERLNALAARREKELDEISEERLKLKERRRTLAQRFEKERQTLLDTIKTQAQAVVKEWKTGKLGRKETQKKLSELRDTLTSADASDAPPAAPSLSWNDLVPGLRVSYPAWNKTGTVQDRDERRNQVKVDFSGVGLWVDAAALQPIASDPRPQSAAPQSAKADPDRTATLDLRGHRADQALAVLEHALDRALLDGFGRMEIVHGRGTGALRREVHEFLKHHPSVASYALASEEHGGDGMTEVALR